MSRNPPKEGTTMGVTPNPDDPDVKPIGLVQDDNALEEDGDGS